MTGPLAWLLGATLLPLPPVSTAEMQGRVDPLFPECCHGCGHLERPAWTCDHDFSQLLRREFAHDPDRPCPVATDAE